MSDNTRKKGAQRLKRSFMIRKNNVAFDILNDNSQYVTLVQMKVSTGNLNHDVSAVGYFIVDYKFEKGLSLNKAYLDIICLFHR